MSPSPSSAAPGWSDDRVTLLSRLWGEGLSAAQIASQLGGVTRSAVIGKAYRLGLGGRATPSAPRAVAARPPRPRPRQRVASPPPRTVRPDTAAAPPAPEAPGLVDDLLQLGPRTCKWPIGDPKGPSFSFCGRPAEGRYCAAHAAKAARPGAPWRPDRDPVVKRALAGLV